MDATLKKILDQALERALAFTLEEEGGWSDHVNDKGGATKYGITLETFRKRPGRAGATAGDLRKMTMGEARLIYKEDYWFWESLAAQPALAQAVSRLDARVLVKTFDMGVNMGPRQAAKLLQRACNRAMRDAISEDGVLGPVTLAVAGACDPDRLLAALCEVQEEFYIRLVERDRTQAAFIKGWTKRARRLP